MKKLLIKILLNSKIIYLPYCIIKVWFLELNINNNTLYIDEDEDDIYDFFTYIANVHRHITYYIHTIIIYARKWQAAVVCRKSFNRYFISYLESVFFFFFGNTVRNTVCLTKATYASHIYHKI